MLVWNCRLVNTGAGVGPRRTAWLIEGGLYSVTALREMWSRRLGIINTEFYRKTGKHDQQTSRHSWLPVLILKQTLGPRRMAWLPALILKQTAGQPLVDGLKSAATPAGRHLRVCAIEFRAI